MTLYDLLKTLGAGKGEGVMWKSVAVISDAMEKYLDEDAKKDLMTDIYGIMSDGHYDETYAKMCVGKLYYTDESGKKHFAPYWTEQQIRTVYDSVAKRIPSAYNFWDFYVTLNMVASDNWPLLRKWFPEADVNQLTEKVAEMTVAWLDDPDNPYGDSKTWGYLHGR